MPISVNTPQVKLALVGVSRDCFPIDLTRTRLGKLTECCENVGLDVYSCNTIIENEGDTLAALAEVADAGANSAVIYLGNFGPEGPLSIFAEHFDGPVMACAAAEESKDTLVGGRGDAYCGMLNASYSFGLRNVPVYIPQMPVGLPDELAAKIKHFATVARIIIGVLNLKIFAFGPRPQDFYACNAPIKPLYDMGVEVMENSELDLWDLYNAVDEEDPAIAVVAKDMADELGEGNTYPDLLPKLARFELALLRFCEENLGSRSFGVFADKCWPAFEKAFGFVPCYVNSRLALRGIPVACEVDMYGALSEYFCQLASDNPATLLDINNTVPTDMLGGVDLKGATTEDLFMGFHCGNTPSSCMKNCSMKYQLIMNRLIEDPSNAPDITRGTLDGQIKPGPTTFFRLQGNAESQLVSYVCEGNILDIDPMSFGGIGVFAIPNFARFYRHVLIGKRFPHHGAVAFNHCGKALFDAVKFLGVDDINVPLTSSMRYQGENPFDILC
ncbi:MAG: fucose isomerase [Armatimonadota bacterium]|nr:fucose isomerase [bacterium]